MKRFVFLIIPPIVLLIALGPRPKMGSYSPRLSQLPENLDAWLRESESPFPLRPNVSKTILWTSSKKSTPKSLIYLHGFSATRREISPVVEKVSRQITANAFFTRLKGHGMTGTEIAQVTPSDWFHDAEEALGIGKRIGKKVIVIGMSSGATLAIWLASRHPEILAVILVSPNFSPKDKRANILLWPWGVRLLKFFVGPERSWKPKNSSQAEIWTYRYPLEALVPMALLTKESLSTDLEKITMPVLTLFTDRDETVDTELIKKTFRRFGSKVKDLIEVKEAKEHVLAGDATSPETTDLVVKTIVDWVERL